MDAEHAKAGTLPMRDLDGCHPRHLSACNDNVYVRRVLLDLVWLEGPEDDQ